MAARSKEEQQLLDEKIARIQKKNEEILRRQKEIEEDKRLAEKQNALVKLRPLSSNDSRERTPALKPSKRDLQAECSDEIQFQGPIVQRNTRGNFRGGERFRGQGDRKASGPPPDPKSFLYDDERDRPQRDSEMKGDFRRGLDRKRSDQRDFRDENHGGREFQRGGRRGGTDYRTERGGYRRGNRARSGRNEEEAWRAERMRIDEARIQRQKSADGKWRREWDNEKISQENFEEPMQGVLEESRRELSSNQDHRYSPDEHHQHHLHRPHHHHQHHQHHQCLIHHIDHPQYHPQYSTPRGRGRGRLDPSELETPLDNIPVLTMPKKFSPQINLDREYFQKAYGAVDPSPKSNSSYYDPSRSIECVGDTFKISVPNTNAGKSSPKGQHKTNEPRGRLKSQTSYSSQSDEDCPRDRAHRGGRSQRNQRYQKCQDKSNAQTKEARDGDNLPEENKEKIANTTTNIGPANVCAQSKPPLPPLRPSQKAADKEGDDSWEDMTTSGAESVGEDRSSVHSTPEKQSTLKITIINNTKCGDRGVDLSSSDILEIQSSDVELDGNKVSSLTHNLNDTIPDEILPSVSVQVVEGTPREIVISQMESVIADMETNNLDKSRHNIGNMNSVKCDDRAVDLSSSDILEIQSSGVNIDDIEDSSLENNLNDTYLDKKLPSESVKVVEGTPSEIVIAQIENVTADVQTTNLDKIRHNVDNYKEVNVLSSGGAHSNEGEQNTQSGDNLNTSCMPITQDQLEKSEEDIKEKNDDNKHHAD